MNYNPTIIIKCLSTQATYINKKLGQMFYFTDSRQLYADVQNNRILADDVYILDFERERLNYIPNNRSTMATEPDALTTSQQLLNYIYVYVIETNSLYNYNYTTKVWNTIYGVYGVQNVAQTRNVEGNAILINADDVTTNGILNDGSVVIRDNNKMICGLLKSDGYTLNVLGLIGGQINIDATGSVNGEGCLQLNSKTATNLNNDLLVFGNIKQTNKNNWSKQYRLITEDIKITQYTLIKKGSTLKATSILNNTTYQEDITLTEDIETTSVGKLATNSKIYKDSIINNNILLPPYLFDIDIYDTTVLNTSLNVHSSLVSVENIKLKININCPFNNYGDYIYVNNSFKTKLSTILNVVFNDKSLDIDYKATEGINNSFKIVYSSAGMVKILP